MTTTATFPASTMPIHVYYLACGHVQWTLLPPEEPPVGMFCTTHNEDVNVLSYEDKIVPDLPWQRGGVTELAWQSHQHLRGQETAKDWYERELQLAKDAHELTVDLVREAEAILYGPSDVDEITDDQYTRAAQLIACRRNTCGGPGTGHEHVAWPHPCRCPAGRTGGAPQPSSRRS